MYNAVHTVLQFPEQLLGICHTRPLFETQGEHDTTTTVKCRTYIYDDHVSYGNISVIIIMPLSGRVKMGHTVLVSG